MGFVTNYASDSVHSDFGEFIINRFLTYLLTKLFRVILRCVIHFALYCFIPDIWLLFNAKTYSG